MADSPITQLATQTQATSPPVESRTGESHLVDWVETLFTDAEKAKQQSAKTESWGDLETGYWGEMWGDTSNLPSFKPPIVINEGKTLTLQEVSDLTDSPIKIFVQRDRQKPDRDKNVEKAMQAYWMREFVDLTVMQAALYAETYPCGFFAGRYNPLADNGRGKFELYPRHPKTVFPDPDATSDDNWNHVFYQDVFDLTYIHQAWPDQGPRVRPDARYSLNFPPLPDSQPRTMGVSGRFQSPMYAGSTVPISNGYSKARAAVLTLFIKDELATEDDFIERVVERMSDETKTLISTKEIVAVKKKKYPQGRLIQISNGVVLFDGPNPYRGRFPVVRVCLEPTLGTFWPPLSIHAETLETYRAANKMDSLVVENGIRLNGGILVASTLTQIDPAKWANIPGQVLLVPPGQVDQVKMMYPQPMPADMVQGGEKLRTMARNQRGMRESRIGAGQRGNVSAELTETEIDQSMGLTRLRARLLHSSVQKLAEILFAGMAQFYQVQRIIPHIKGDRWEPITWDPIEKPDAYAIHVDPASFQIRAQTAIKRLYIALARLNKMPDEELLNALDIPNAQEVSEKLKQQLTLQAWAGYNKSRKGKKP